MTTISLTAQECFDISVRGIIAQGGPSRKGRLCRYRATDGKKCAAGHLIPDEVYYPTMEGKVVRNLSLRFKNENLVDALQYAHDKTATLDFFKHWKPKLERIAEDYKLDPTVLEEIPT